MGEALSDYLDIIVSTIIFASAVSLLFIVLDQFNDNNKLQIKDLNSKNTVTVNTQYGYAEDEIKVSSEEVFTDIMNFSLDGVSIFVTNSSGTTTINTSFLNKLRELDNTAITTLKGAVGNGLEYKIEYKYDANKLLTHIRYIQD